MCQCTHAVNVPKIKGNHKKHPCVVITFGGLSGLPLNLEMRRSALSCILGMCMGPGSVRCSGIRSCQWRSFQTSRFWVQLRKTKAPGCVLQTDVSNVYFRESFGNLSSLTSFSASILEGFIDSMWDKYSKIRTHSMAARWFATWNSDLISMLNNCLLGGSQSAYKVFQRRFPWVHIYLQAATSPQHNPLPALKQATLQIITRSTDSDWSKQQATSRGRPLGEM